MIFFSKSAEHFWLRYSAGLLDKRNLAISLEKYSQKHDFGFMKDKFTSVRSAKFYQIMNSTAISFIYFYI